MKNQTKLLMSLLVLTSLTTFAAPFDRSRIAADAKWVVHANMEQFAASELGKQVAEKLEETEGASKFNNLKQFLSFDPLKDIKELTLYGTDFSRDNGAAIIRADYDKDKFLSMLKEKPGYEELKLSDHTVYHWQADVPTSSEENLVPMKDHYAGTYSDNFLLVTGDKEMMQAALNVLDGKVANLKANSEFDLGAVPGYAFLTVAGQGFAKAVDQGVVEGQAAIMSKIENLILTFGEKEKNLLLDLNLTTTDDQSALAIKNLMQGLVGMAMLKQDQASQQRQKLIQALNFSTEGSVVKIDLSFPVNDFTEMLKKQDIKLPPTEE